MRAEAPGPAARRSCCPAPGVLIIVERRRLNSSVLPHSARKAPSDGSGARSEPVDEHVSGKAVFSFVALTSTRQATSAVWIPEHRLLRGARHKVIPGDHQRAAILEHPARAPGVGRPHAPLDKARRAFRRQHRWFHLRPCISAVVADIELQDHEVGCGCSRRRRSHRVAFSTIFGAGLQGNDLHPPRPSRHRQAGGALLGAGEVIRRTLR